MRVGQLARQRAEGGSAAPTALGLRGHERIDEEREAIQGIDHRLAQDRQATLGEPLELAVQDFVAEFFLALEVVIEMTLAREPGLTNDVINGSLRVAALRDQLRGGIKDLDAAIVHTRILGLMGPIVKTGRTLCQAIIYHWLAYINCSGKTHNSDRF